jgi:hypothetical protein
MIDAHELALLLQGVQLSPRKMHPKQIANQSREKALRAISSLTTDSVRE